MLQQVTSRCQLQYQVGALAVLVGLIELNLANTPVLYVHCYPEEVGAKSSGNVRHSSSQLQGETRLDARIKKVPSEEVGHGVDNRHGKDLLCSCACR